MRQSLRVGEVATMIAKSASEPFATSFEDDGETAYFYAIDLRRAKQIVDAVWIYDVASVVDGQRESLVEIVWSGDGSKSALLINRYPHAIFDFSAKREYCRTGSPDCDRLSDEWQSDTHTWDDSVMKFFDL